MQQISLNTYHLSPQDQFSSWKDLVCEQFLLLECQNGPSKPTFAGGVELISNGSFSIGRVKASSHKVIRSSTMMSRDHKHSYYINMQRSGSCRLLDHNGREQLVKPGQAFLVNSNMNFAMDFDGDFEHFVIEMPSSMIKVDSEIGASLLTPKNASERLALSMLSLVEKEFLDGQFESELDINTLMKCTEIFSERFSHHKDVSLEREYISERHLRLQRVLKVIEENIANPSLNPEFVANACGISRRTLFRYFDANEDSPASLINRKRVEYSKELLSKKTNLSISEVCFHAGFSDSSNYARQFKKITGMSPTDYRNQKSLY